jgi:hypothetical protein
MAQDSLDEMFAGMSNADYKKYAEEQAKELYGTDEIEVGKDGSVTVGSGDSAQEISKEEF